MIKKVGYGTWEILKEFNQKEVQKSTHVAKDTLRPDLNFLRSDDVRGHAFVFTVRLPKVFSRSKRWREKREQFLQQQGIKYKKLNIIGGGQRIDFRGRKVWLTNRSLIIYERKSYIAEYAFKSKALALHDLFNLVKALERLLKANFGSADKYLFKVSRQHYSLVKNALARQYDHLGKKLSVYSNQGLWFQIDNSFNLHEAETLHPKTADEDNKKVQDFFNGIKKTAITPQFILEAMNGIQQNQSIFAKNMQSHIEAIQELGKATKELSSEVKKISSQGKILKTKSGWMRCPYCRTYYEFTDQAYDYHRKKRCSP